MSDDRHYVHPEDAGDEDRAERLKEARDRAAEDKRRLAAVVLPTSFGPLTTQDVEALKKAAQEVVREDMAFFIPGLAHLPDSREVQLAKGILAMAERIGVFSIVPDEGPPTELGLGFFIDVDYGFVDAKEQKT